MFLSRPAVTTPPHHLTMVPVTVQSIKSQDWAILSANTSPTLSVRMRLTKPPKRTKGNLMDDPAEAVCDDWWTSVVVGTTVLVVPFCVMVHVKGSTVVVLDEPHAVLSSVHPSKEGVGDGSVAVTRTVGRLEPRRLLRMSEGTMEPGRTVTLPAASVAEKKVSSVCSWSCLMGWGVMVTSLAPPTA